MYSKMIVVFTIACCELFLSISAGAQADYYRFHSVSLDIGSTRPWASPCSRGWRSDLHGVMRVIGKLPLTIPILCSYWRYCHFQHPTARHRYFLQLVSSRTALVATVQNPHLNIIHPSHKTLDNITHPGCFDYKSDRTIFYYIRFHRTF